ncbi:carbonic anhydrase [Sulfurovum sp.]|uniref:carbonic anhydrase n=1 Tax=Sulfurovum sp. TaxID=1969726 RepID=UPI002A366117|nr:carbonic anhydrase [Sulfurovum sp.]MDD2450397.1 carbonic anhydrase [Sulfurovum sp.]MDD3498841.1 carbonic anhydrase [Sulfurovum sp.]MDY0403302.1 carbonic anhydrase [Sulfurovum sp.]
MPKSTLLQGNEVFQNSYFKKHERELLELATKGQHPKALFIGCSDSRVIPNLITDTPPGDLFVIRNVGNFVAPYKPDEDFHSTAAGIEYAVSALNVSEIIICGHTHCGAIASLYSDIEEKAFIHTKKWLSLGHKAKTHSLLALGNHAPRNELCRLSEKLNVIFQIENLLTYPYLKEKVDAGELHIHGWLYDMERGTIDYYDPELFAFLPIEELKNEEQ